MTSGLSTRQIKFWFLETCRFPAASVHFDISGGNSRIYRIKGSNGKIYAGKVYANSRMAERLERISREAAALQLMQSEGFTNIPQLVGIDPKKRMLVYEYIPGKKINQQQITDVEFRELPAFIKKLSALRSKKQVTTIIPAREACLSLAATIQVVESRRKRLEKVIINNPNLKNFLENDFDKIFAEVKNTSQAVYRQAGIGIDQDLSKSHQTLSPSDYGFHNALVKSDGAVVFLDFEHFGWDDPAKMTADFLNHPQNRLSQTKKSEFVRAMTEIFIDDRNFPVRLKAVYPLHALKWCLLILNEFLPEQLKRRRFAKYCRLRDTLVQEKQLEKAKKLLKNYPYAI